MAFEEAASILGEGFVGVLVRDGWGVYRRFLAADHQTCLAHLLRRCHEMRELAWGRAHEVPRLVGGILSDALALRDLQDFEDIDEGEFQLQLTALEDRMDQLLARPAISQTDADSDDCSTTAARAGPHLHLPAPAGG